LNKIKRIDSYYIVTRIKEHKEIKNKLLNLISQIPRNSYENITHTDWSLPKDYKREYLDYFYTIIKPYIDDMRDLLKEKTCEIQNGWFQQYYQNDFHQWHRHAKTNFANVYYLELPDKKMTTKIRPILNGKKVQNFVAKEGDLVTFPAMMQHTSEKSSSNLRKTIISFNSDFY
jgi:hypothetical protein|tara:strand:+ start:7539 stop:8057 length:519 start_codon:yes stop_codon:yes gene_type:complete